MTYPPETKPRDDTQLSDGSKALLAFDAWQRSGVGRTIARIGYHNGKLTNPDLFAIFEAGWNAHKSEDAQ